MKCIIQIPILVLLCHGCWAQDESMDLKSLYDNSTIVIQGQIKRNVSKRFEVGDWMKKELIVQIEIDSLYKGNPKISTFKKFEYVLYDDHASFETTDSTTGVCAHFIKRFYYIDTVLVSFPEHTFIEGEKVIVFLNQLVESPLGNRLKQPEDWYVYSLMDEDFGIVPATDYIVEQIKKLSKH